MKNTWHTHSAYISINAKRKIENINLKMKFLNFPISLRDTSQNVLLPEGDQEHHCDFFILFV